MVRLYARCHSHGINAFERTDGEDTVVVVHALRFLHRYLQNYASSFLYEYELNLTTGEVISEV